MTNVVVAIEPKFHEDFGAYERVFLWDGQKIEPEFCGDYWAFTHERYDVNASKEAIKEAGEAYRVQMKDTSDQYGMPTYIGCEVLIKGSRKVKQGVYTIVNYRPHTYNGRYYIDAKVCVKVDDTTTEWISANCEV